jgi:DUF438 domain-containing protein
MSELIENNRRKKELLKHLMLQVHKGEAPEAVRKQLSRIMGEKSSKGRSVRPMTNQFRSGTLHTHSGRKTRQSNGN